MQLAYLKMHGTGNRILVVDERGKNRPVPPPDTLIHLGDETTGPGFDQLMWVTDSDEAGIIASYRVFNADGTEVEQCGNGVRCVAWMLARDAGNRREFLLASPAGPITARPLDDDQVSVSMGAPEFRPAHIPFLTETESPQYELAVGGTKLRASVLSMGNPHCVIEVPSVADADVATFGPAIEGHERFPERCNVGFMRVLSRDEIELRVFERGVGETLACGTGACAAVVAAQQMELVDEEVRVNLPGGQLVVSWRGDTETVWLTGNVELINEGSIDL